MRATVSSLSRRLLSTFFAATLVLGLVPVAAFADDVSGPIDADSVESSEEMTIEGTDPSIDDADEPNPVVDASVFGEDVVEDDAATGDDANLGTPILAGDIINQEMALSTVAQAESTRSYFLAQTLESTKTVPVVSAKLPLDQGTNQQSQAGADGGQIAVGSEDKVTDGDLPAASTEAEAGDEAEGGEDSDESDLEDVVTFPGISAESTVVGAFEYLGMTFAVEPGGESVALVAVDYSKLPDEFVQKQIIVIPDMATPDELDYYSVTRIADSAFASLTKETADPDYTGCIELFSDEELLAEAGISQEEVQEFLNAEPVENEPIEPSDDIRTIVSMDGNVATLDDGSTYTFTNPLAGCTGVLALGIPASVSSIEDEAFSGFETLQYLVVSDDDPEYASYDGALYSADLTNLRLIPEGRVGAVRVASSATSVDPEVFSHCPSVDALVADADSLGRDAVEAVTAPKTLFSDDARLATEMPCPLVGLTSGMLASARHLSLLASLPADLVLDATSSRLSSAASTSSLISSAFPKAAISFYKRSSYIGQGTVLLYDGAGDPSSYCGGMGLGNQARQWGHTWSSTLSGVGAAGAGNTYDAGWKYVGGGLTGGGHTTNALQLFYSDTYGFYLKEASSSPRYAQLVNSSGWVLRCEAVAVITSTGGPCSERATGYLLIAPPYTIATTYHGWWTDSRYGTQIQGSWTGGTTSASDCTQSFDSNIEEDGTGKITVLDGTKLAGTGDETKYTMPVPDPNNGQYIFVGWNKDKNATAQTEGGWYYRVDGKYGTGTNAQITETTESVDLYAIYQRGYPINLNVSKFGGSTAQLVDKPATSGNSFSADGANGQEVVAITDTTVSTGSFRFPRVTHPSNDNGASTDPASDSASDGMRFLGWTNNADGSAPMGGYFKYEDGTYTVSATGLSGPRTFNVATANSTWYAVWESQVDFEAGSYGGKIVGDADGVTDKAWVYNNQPVPSADIPTYAVSGAASGSFVPDPYANTNYDATKWRFEGWATGANPNVQADGSLGGTTMSATSAPGFVAAGGSLVPNGATTYYGVWECDVSWATEHPVTGPDENGATITSSVNAGTTSGDGVNTGWFLYGYAIGSAPGVVTPQSHAFLRWVDPLGRADKAIASATGALVVDTGGVWNATWGPNIYKVAFKGADGQDRELGSIYMKYGDGWYSSYAPASSTTDASVSGPIHGDGNVLRGGTIQPALRDGFICVGYALDPDAKAPEYFYTTDDEGRYVFDNGENPIPPTIFNDRSRGTTAGVGSEADLKVGYLYPVWRADVAWDYANSTQSSAADNEVEEQTLYVNNRDGVWGSADEPALGTAAFPSVTVRDQGARAGYAPGRTVTADDGASSVVNWEVAYDPTSLGTDAVEGGQSLTLLGCATMTAQWTAVEYSIEFDLGTLDYKGQTIAYGGDTCGIVKNSLQQSTSLNQGDRVSAKVGYTVTEDEVVIPTFTKAGYQLKGWVVGTPSTLGADAQNLSSLSAAQSDTVLDDGTVRKLLADGYSFATGAGGADTDQVRGNIKLTAVWGEAEPYELTTQVYLDGQLLRDEAQIAALYETKAEGGAFDLPAQYFASGLPLSDMTAKAGYAFAGWKAHLSVDATHTMLMEVGGEPIDNLAADADPAKGADGAALQIRPDTTGDGAVTLSVYFTSITYELLLDLTLPDADKANGTYAGANWTETSGGAGKTFAYRNESYPNSDKDGYTLYERTIDIAAPARKGQSFDGWTLMVKGADGRYAEASDELLAAVLGGTQNGGACTFTVSQQHVGDYMLVARWTESVYSIGFSGIDHVNAASAGEKTSRFVEVSAGAGGDNTFGASVFGFDGDTLTGGHTVVVRELGSADYDTARYASFKGWYLPEGTGDLAGLFTEDGKTGRFYARSLTIDQAHLDELFGTPADDGTYAISLEAVFEPVADYALAIDLAGGTLGGAAPAGWTKGTSADGSVTFSRTYSCESGDIALPDPTRYGYAFLGWTLRGTGLDPDAAGDVGSGWSVKGDSIGDRTYTARWQPAQDALLLYNNLSSVYPEMDEDANPSSHVVTYGAAMPAVPKPYDPHNTLDPSTGYVFVGYFDTPATTGGKQYYALNNAGAPVSARAWDRAPEFEEDGTTPIPHALYARWEAVAPEGTPDANKTQNAYGASASIASRVDGEPSTTAAETAFAATYNGRFTHEATGRITVKVNSYAFADGITPRSIYDAFNATRAADAAEKYLCGFVVESTGDLIAFSDLALGRAFEFSFKAADSDGSVAEPGFSVLSDAVYAIYSTTPFDFESGEGGEPPSLEPIEGRSTILASFDANGGSFADGKTSAVTTTLFGHDAAAGQSPYVSLPAPPEREGYEFAGWAATTFHVEGDHATDHIGAIGSQLFGIDSILAKRYFAHWNVRTCTVKLRLGYDGAPAPATIHVPFDSTAHLASYDGTAAFAEPTPREGYVFLGWFDDGNTGLQYFTSTGAATRPWDYEADPAGADAVTLSAHWLDLNAPNTGSDSDPENPVPADPFPGQEVEVTPTANGNDQLRMPARGAYAEGGAAAVALDGTYDGLFYATEPVSDASEVAVVLYAYAPATVHDDVRHIISSYEANAPAGTYLQGFRIGSTNSFISIADLYAGNPVTFYLSGADLVNGVADRASVVFASGKVEAEYGPTQQVPPESFEGEEWPDMSANPPAPSPLPQVHNTFDARAGAFEGGLRFMTVDSGYGEPVRIPAEEPALEDATYHFDAWYYVNARGEMCKLEVDENGLALSLKVGSVAPMTFYARYVRTYYDFTVVDAQDGVKDIHLSDGGAERTVGAFSPYEGETLTLMNDEFAAMADSLGTRDGYDFIGYFYRTGDAGAYTYRPFYLTGRAENAYAWSHATKMRYDEDFAKLDAHASGWSQLEGIGGSDELDPTKVTLYALWQPITYDIIWQYNWDGRTLGSQQIEYVYQENGTAKAPTVTENVLFGDVIYDDIPRIVDPAFSFEGWYTEKSTTGGASGRVAFTRVDYTAGHDPDTRTEAFATSGEKRFFTDHAGTGDPAALSFEPQGELTVAVNPDTGNRCFTFFAGFTSSSIGYTYRIYLSRTAEDAHWNLDASLRALLHEPADGPAYLETTYQPQYAYDLTTAYDGKITAATGYRKSGWFASADSDVRIDLDGNVRIPQWSCGMQQFWIGWDHNAYEVALKLNTLEVGATDEQGDEVLSAPQGLLRLAPEANSFALDLDMDEQQRTIVLPEVQGAIGYRFVGWKRCDESGRLFVDDALGTSFATYAAGDEILVDADYIADEWNFGGAESGTVYYGAVWAPYTYEVRFHERPDASYDDDDYEVYSLVSDTTSDDSGSRMVLPYLHSTLSGAVFRFWSLLQQDARDPSPCAGWTSGSELTLDDIFALQVDAEGFVEKFEGDVAVIDLWPQLTFIASSTVPLQVNVLIDPWNPYREDGEGKIVTNEAGYYVEGADGQVGWTADDGSGRAPQNVVANAWLATSYAAPVRIESLTFERESDGVFATAQGDKADLFELLVYAGGTGQRSEPLRINLAGEVDGRTIFLRDGATGQDTHLGPNPDYLSSYAGFDTEIVKGSPLLIHYDLAWDASLDDLSAFTTLVDPSKLLDASATGGTALGRATLPIAKLYYTIGLAR